MFRNRYVAPSGDRYTGCGQFNSIDEAQRAARMAERDALPGTRYLLTFFERRYA